MKTNFEDLLLNLITPIVNQPDDVSVQSFVDIDETVVIQVMVAKDDLGRVIGKQGKIANAIRTIAYTYASKQDKRVKVEFDSFE